MQVFNSKQGKMYVCSDRTCGFQQSGKEERFGGKKSRQEHLMNQRLIQQYSDHKPAVTNVGDLLKAALGQQEPKEE